VIARADGERQWTPFASALYPPNESKNGPELGPVAKAFIQAGGVDPLRDHAIIYAKALEEEWKAEVKLHVYEGYGHMFWTNFPRLKESRKFWKDTVEGFEWMLGQERRREW
jgi:acetyl esterase/lipase